MVLSVVSAFNSFGLGVLVWGLVVQGKDGDGDPFFSSSFVSSPFLLGRLVVLVLDLLTY